MVTALTVDVDKKSVVVEGINIGVDLDKKNTALILC